MSVIRSLVEYFTGTKVVTNLRPQLHHVINIAKNPNLQPRHLDKLVNDSHFLARAAVAGNPSLPAHHIDKLVNDFDPLVRSEIASHPSLQPRHIDKLVNEL